MNFNPYQNISSLALNEIYQQSTLSSHIQRPNGLTHEFLSPQNISFIIHEIERVTSEKAGFPVKIQLNSDVVYTIIRVATSNAGFVRYPRKQAIAYMNAQVIQHESFIAYESLILKMLHHKYFIENDRMFVMPYGELTHEPKGDTILESSGYMLSHPWKRARPEALLFGNGMAPITTLNEKVAPIYEQTSYITDPIRIPSVTTIKKENENLYAPICGYLQPKNSSFSTDI